MCKDQEKKVSKASKVLRLTGKIAAWTVGVLVVLLAVGLLLRNVIVEQAVKRVTPLVTGTPAEIDSFSSNLFTGEIVLKGFRIGNPEGYVEPHAIVLDTLRVKLAPGSLLKDTITVSEIFISGVGVNFELKANGDSNLTDIQKNVDSFTKAVTPAAGEKKKTEKKADKDAPKKQVVIAFFRQEKGFLSASIGLTKTTMKLPLLPVEATNIGGGSSLGETISVIFTEIITSAGNALDSVGLNMKNLKGVSDSVLKNLSKGGNFILDGGKNGTSIVIEGAADSGKAVVDGVKSLFKKGSQK